MNILIIGEFSGFSRNLKQGFVANGDSCVVVTSGDAYKNIPYSEDDIKYKKIVDLHIGNFHIPGSQRIFAPLSNAMLNKRIRANYPSFDLIIVINISFISKSPFFVGVEKETIQYYKEKGAKVIMSCCGMDPALLINFEKGKLKYTNNIFPNGVNIPYKKDIPVYDWLIKISDIIIPTSFEYMDSVRNYCFCKGFNKVITEVIPVPVVKEICKIDSCEFRKKRILLGITRKQLKGTDYFIEALKKINSICADKIDISIIGNLPFVDYLSFLDSTDILLDQTNSYGLGINAVLGLMKGKVVFGGNEPENERSMHLGECPVINATPDVDLIVKNLIDLINHPPQIDYIKRLSYEFALKNLESSLISYRYLKSLELIKKSYL